MKKERGIEDARDNERRNRISSERGLHAAEYSDRSDRNQGTEQVGHDAPRITGKRKAMDVHNAEDGRGTVPAPLSASGRSGGNVQPSD